jgi:hypothetical protein
MRKLLTKSQGTTGMKTGIIGVLLAIILALALYLPALAQNNTEEITITINTGSTIGITLSQANWDLGNVSSNMEYLTEPPAEWCTITNTGNTNVNLKIEGVDAKQIGYPAYKWNLSDDETNGEHKYVLWYHIAGDDVGSYTLVTEDEVTMQSTKHGSQSDLSLQAHDDHAQFGLKLLTPTYFYGDRTMETNITISAVAS